MLDPTPWATRSHPGPRLSRRARDSEAFTSGLEATDKLLSELSGCMKATG